jgi:hypothetical protein
VIKNILGHIIITTLRQEIKETTLLLSGSTLIFDGLDLTTLFIYDQDVAAHAGVQGGACGGKGLSQHAPQGTHNGGGVCERHMAA